MIKGNTKLFVVILALFLGISVFAESSIGGKFTGNFTFYTEYQVIENGEVGLKLFKDDGTGLLDPDNWFIFKFVQKSGEQKFTILQSLNGNVGTIDEIYITDVSRTVNPGALKVVYDKFANCLHFYYQFTTDIYDKQIKGWSELKTFDGWENYGFHLQTYSEGNSKLYRTKAFVTPPEDPSENGVFGARWRKYTFSGFTNDAVVVSFDKQFFPRYKDIKFVFWKEANYIPWWHLNNRAAACYEFVETWEDGEPGCFEPMSDRVLRWSNVEIVESNPVRVVVHWRYMLANYLYRLWYEGYFDEKVQPWVDEYYYLYPDGTGIRKIVYVPIASCSNEVSELIAVNGGGTFPSDNLEWGALTLMNLENGKDTYSWDIEEPSPVLAPDTPYWPIIIARMNFKDASPYIVFVQDFEYSDEIFPTAPLRIDTWEFERYGSYQYSGDFNAFSHWPISKQPYENPYWSAGRYVRQPSHTSLISINAGSAPFVGESTTWAFLFGLASKDDLKSEQEIKNKVKSWLKPGKIETVTDNLDFLKNNLQTKTLIFKKTDGSPICAFKVLPLDGSVLLINPCIEIQNWGNSKPFVCVDDQELSSSSYRYFIRADGTLLLWIGCEFTNPVKIEIKH